jgi:hypothetical protein
MAIEYNNEAESALLMVASLPKPEGAGNEFKKMCTKKN